MYPLISYMAHFKISQRDCYLMIESSSRPNPVVTSIWRYREIIRPVYRKRMTRGIVRYFYAHFFYKLLCIWKTLKCEHVVVIA